MPDVIRQRKQFEQPISRRKERENDFGDVNRKTEGAAVKPANPWRAGGPSSSSYLDDEG